MDLRLIVKKTLCISCSVRAHILVLAQRSRSESKYAAKSTIRFVSLILHISTASRRVVSAQHIESKRRVSAISESDAKQQSEAIVHPTDHCEVT